MGKGIAYIFLTIGLFFTFVPFATAGLTHDDMEELSNELNRIPQIRVGITYGPGAGHQGASVSVVTRLREIGYLGEIQIVYDSVNTANKLIYLIPPFKGDKGGELQNYFDEKLSFVGFKYLEKSNLPEVPLAIMGADEQGKSPKDLRARALLKLQPMNWPKAPTLAYYNDHQEVEERTLSQLKSKGFVVRPHNPQNLKEFLIKQLSHELFNDRLSFFSFILHQDQPAEILPVYSHGVRRENFQLTTLLNALVMAKLKNKSLFKSGIIIPVFNAIDEKGISKLTNYISAHRNSDRQDKIQIVTYDVTDPILMEILQKGLGDTIVIVRVGSIPKPLFEYTYQRATLPGIVEGRNSINMMSNFGLPYLPSCFEEGFHFFSANQSFFKRVLARTGLGRLFEKAWKELVAAFPEDVDDLAKFYTLAATKREKLQSFAAQFKTDSLNDDQVALGLTEYFSLQIKNRENVSPEPGGKWERVNRKEKVNSCALSLVFKQKQSKP